MSSTRAILFARDIIVMQREGEKEQNERRKMNKSEGKNIRFYLSSGENFQTFNTSHLIKTKSI